MSHPAHTYEKISQMLEVDEKKRIDSLITERRTRIGAKLVDVANEAKREVYANSKLEYIYRQLINWTRDDELRHTYEDKLLVYCYERLVCAPKAQKESELQIVRALAEGMVIIKHPFKLAWDITIEWKDAEEIRDWDVNILREYCSFFPDSDLYKVITGFLTSKISPFPPRQEQTSAALHTTASTSSDDDDDGGGVPTEEIPTTEEDRLLMMTEGINSANSVLAYRLMGEYYQHLQEHESNVELMRKALEFIRSEYSKIGLKFSNSRNAINLHLGTALVFYQSPRHHQEAKAIFDRILEHKPNSTAAMIGVGLIYEEEEEFDNAIDFFERALARDEGNLRIRSEASWVKALKGDYETAKVELEECILLIRKSGNSKIAKELLALSLYRLGVCIWNSDSSNAARKNKKTGAYRLFLEALNHDLFLAPAYTMLGIYFADYAKDMKRARRCFQQAVELSPSEVRAAERLARSFAENGSWDHVELIAQRVVGSGKVKPPPGSKRKGISWPYAALGVAELNKGDFPKSIASFQAALRMEPEDYPAWVGLGESYASSGRYIAAAKAIIQAQALEGPQDVGANDTWFTKYMLANIKRETAEYDEAISLYEEVLVIHPTEAGAAIALLQTFVEGGYDCIIKGLFGKAIDLAIDTIHFATQASSEVTSTFNFWKAIGDACSFFSHIRSRLADFPTESIKGLLGPENEAYAILADIDGIDTGVVNAQGLFAEDETFGVSLTQCLHASILSHKMAIHVSSDDIHAQAVAYYNLGWAEHRAHICLPQNIRRISTKYLKASARCFKRAIELEPGNAEFWNALGVTTSCTHPSVGQHAFVRSLHINERNPVAWTNLGTLALLNNDIQLAYEAFTKGQSNDPEYAHAWVGQGLVALLRGEVKEARTLFTHAADISDASSLSSRRQYSTSLFDHVLLGSPSLDVSVLVGPLFALDQLTNLDPQNDVILHLSALFRERVCDTKQAVSQLHDLYIRLEAEYTNTKAPFTLIKLILTMTDLARMHLTEKSYDAALSYAKAALQRTETAENKSLSGEETSKARLSCHLTIGLAYYHLGKPGDAVKYMEMALSETRNNPDAVCLLAQVLWATNTTDTREQARSILFEVIEEQPEHVSSVLLLGTIALLDEDEETQEAVLDTLLSLRTSDAADTPTLRRGVAEVLSALSACRDSESIPAQTEAQTEIILYPNLPHGWRACSKLVVEDFESEGRHTAEMATKVAFRAVPPRGHLSAEDLCDSLIGMERLADAQKAVMIAPWKHDGWEQCAVAI